MGKIPNYCFIFISLLLLCYFSIDEKESDRIQNIQFHYFDCLKQEEIK